MSELKAKHVVDVYDAYSSNPYNESQVYLKSEADKVIAELKKEKEYVIEQTAEVINGQERELSRQKYKRCLAMARWCKSEQTYSSFSIYVTEHPKSRWAGRSVLIGAWLAFWKNRERRWLKLAKQFKES